MKLIPSSGTLLRVRIAYIGGPSPDAGASEAHRPEAEAIAFDFATDPK